MLVRFPFLRAGCAADTLAAMPAEMITALGAAAAAYSVAAGTTLLLQAQVMRRRGSSREVSIAFLASTTGGYLIWLLYGIGIGSLPLILADAIGLVCGGIAVGVAASLRRSPRPEVPDRTEPCPAEGRRHLRPAIASAGTSSR